MRNPVGIVAVFCALVLTSILSLQAQPENWAVIRAKTEQALLDAVNDTPGLIGVVIEDLQEEDRFAWNENTIFPQGSAIKIPILVEVLLQAEEGRFALSDRIDVTAVDQVGGSGILEIFSDGGSALSIHDLCELMIFLSDNTATNLLIDKVGTVAVNKRFSRLGLDPIKLQRRMMDTAARGRGEENLATPASAARLMRLLHERKIGDKTSSDEIMRMLRRPKGGALKAGLPADVPVAFKPGGIPGVATEWAIIELPERPFIIVFMGNFGLGEGFDGNMKNIAEIAYQYFKRKGTSTRYGTYVDPQLISR